MWSPQICLFLVVTPLLVCAAPAAPLANTAPLSVEIESIQQHLVNVGSEDLTVKRSANVDSLDSTVKRSARIDSFLAIPSTEFTCSAQAVPGIYADQETGCQVFHYCQDDGRMDSFFCPNLTLFNQQYFVCDWEYNVDCNSAHQYFSLNEALYKTPEKIYQAIHPAIKIVQNELLQGAASSEVSRTLNSLVSKLDSRTSAIVVDSSLPPTPPAQQTQPRLLTQAETDRESKSLSSLPEINSFDAEREGKSADAGGNSVGYNTLPSYSQTPPTIVTAAPVIIPTVTISPIITDEGSADIVNTAQSAYALADPYDDAVADPEPDCFYDGSCTPPVGSGSYATAGQSAGDAYTNVNPSAAAAAAIVNTAQSAYAAADPYDDAVADPEPDCYYTNDCTAADLTSGGYAVVGSAAAGVYNTASAAYAASDNAYDDAVADPEPAGYYSGNSAVTGGSSGTYSVADSSNLATLPSYADAVNSVYDPYDSADPEPSAIPYSASGTYTQYDSADPEPDSYYGYYDSADPEPAAYYGANTIDLSSSSDDSYQSPSSVQYSSPDLTINQAADYDDAVADPEPDPSSYGTNINLYDSSSASGYQQPSYQAYSASNAINDYYKGYPSQGLVVDSPDPEPSSDPEFTPYGE